MKSANFAILVLVAGCGGPEQPAASAADSTARQPTMPESEASMQEADVPTERYEIPILARSGSRLSGSAVLEPISNEHVRITIQVENAESGLHAVQVHETADCSAPDASSAGGPLDPATFDRALSPETQRDMGDLGNLLVHEDGSGRLEAEVQGFTLDKEDETSLLNRAIIVFKERDEGQGKYGDQGTRIGCGEIRPSTAGTVAFR